MFRPENISCSLESALDLSDATGLPPHKLVTFRPERLLVHELLIRVTADLSVPDGDVTADLGINFRRMTEAILERAIEPRMEEILAAYREVARLTEARIAREIGDQEAAPPPPGPSTTETPSLIARLSSLFARSDDRPAPAPKRLDPVQRLELWRRQSRETEPGLDRAVYEALHWALTTVIKVRGPQVSDLQLVASLARLKTLNGHGSDAIGRLIAPWIETAAAELGYRILPAQAKPVVMNVKGASAAGKSTMRQRQHSLADRIEVPWRDFALISPDIWRKYLLDYDSLGEAYRYAGTLTGHEIEVIDRKLDRYMADKAERGSMSHLLIDRFRFDSFTTEGDQRQGGNLLTRFGDLIYMFFMITPPEATVERAWSRGLKIGRYKAVDDLLDHNVEAYTGMPRLFFTWALNGDKRVHYEFLDNSVSEGEQPRTVAFGWNGEMSVLSVKSMLDVDRFRKINIEAKTPEQVYPDTAAMAPENNTAFLEDCARLIPAITFVDRESGRPYLRLEDGQPVAVDGEILPKALTDPDTKAGLAKLVPESQRNSFSELPKPERLDHDQAHTLGEWGG